MSETNVVKLNWSPSHMAALAKPRKPRQKYVPGIPEQLSDLNLDYLRETMWEYTPLRQFRDIPSIGMKKLATPKRVRPKFVRNQQTGTVFIVSPNALKYQATANIKKIAKARLDLGEKPNSNPFAVKAAARSRKKLPPAKRKIYDRLATPSPYRMKKL